MQKAVLTTMALIGAAVIVAATQVARAGDAPVLPTVELLPDLDQETPTNLEVKTFGSVDKPSYWLGFRSAVRNLGLGPLIVEGHRGNAVTPTMTADQLIERRGAPRAVVERVGGLEYVVSRTHRHWHLLGFDRYELRRATGGRAVVRDRKSGFCLGDRYRVAGVVPSAAPEKAYTSRCGLFNNRLFDLQEGISVGYGDDYAAFLEGQDLPLDGLRAGRYLLVHRVNGDRRLRELSYANNAASVLLRLRWRQGKPHLNVLAVCPDSERCGPTESAPDPIRIRAVKAHVAEAFIPNDDGLSSTPGGWMDLQWNFDGPFGVDAPSAWANLIKAHRPGAARVIVAVLDTGVAYTDRGSFRRSPDLGATRFVPGYDFVDDDAYPFDLNGHGTHVASTIAEQTDNAYGLTGLAYGSLVMPVRVLDQAGDGYPIAIARGIRYAADHGAHVINMSFNFEARVRASQIRQVIKAIAYAHKRGSIVVAAAGNEHTETVDYPARDPRVVSVGATTENGCLAGYSNNGLGLDLVAPGGGPDAYLPDDPACVGGRPGRPIYQIAIRGPRISDFGLVDDYIGTSMATAHVSAAAALVIASGVVGPKPGPAAVRRRLERTSRDLGSPGYDTRYGWGLVDAGTATLPGPRSRRRSGS